MCDSQRVDRAGGLKADNTGTLCHVLYEPGTTFAGNF
jgi:hypothetical protein